MRIEKESKHKAALFAKENKYYQLYTINWLMAKYLRRVTAFAAFTENQTWWAY